MKVPSTWGGGGAPPQGCPKLDLQEVPSAHTYRFFNEIDYGEEDGTGREVWGCSFSLFSRRVWSSKSPKRSSLSAKNCIPGSFRAVKPLLICLP